MALLCLYVEVLSPSSSVLQHVTVKAGEKAFREQMRLNGALRAGTNPI